MSPRFVRLIGASLIVMMLPITAHRTQAQQRGFDLERTKQVLTDLIERTLKETGVPSISIALVRGDSIVWKAAFGYANVRMKTLATPETMYNAASTFKAVTATALVQLAEQGKLQLDHPIDRYLGDSGFRGRTTSGQPITFVHLLSHWSGLTSLPGVGEKEMKSIWGQDNPQSLAQAVVELRSVRPPGTQFEYTQLRVRSGRAARGTDIGRLLRAVRGRAHLATVRRDHPASRVADAGHGRGHGASL